MTHPVSLAAIVFGYGLLALGMSFPARPCAGDTTEIHTDPEERSRLVAQFPQEDQITFLHLRNLLKRNGIEVIYGSATIYVPTQVSARAVSIIGAEASRTFLPVTSFR
jgi:hypothetical protein